MVTTPGYADDRHQRPKDLLLKRRFCEAEDLLWENLNVQAPNYLHFYHTLNQFSEEELEKENFSREKFNRACKGFCENMTSLCLNKSTPSYMRAVAGAPLAPNASFINTINFIWRITKWI